MYPQARFQYANVPPWHGIRQTGKLGCIVCEMQLIFFMVLLRITAADLHCTPLRSQISAMLVDLSVETKRDDVTRHPQLLAA